MKRLLLLTPILVLTPFLAAQTRPTATAVRTPNPPRIDGVLDEPEWALAPVSTTPTQRDPDDGAPASFDTQVRVLYDDSAVYVGARLNDPDPLRFRLGRRDMNTDSSDWFRVSFDTFHDRRNAVRFDVNPAGVRRDATISENYFFGGRGGAGFAGGNGELGWDPVWEARTTRDDKGWTVEMKIPLSQLRYTPGDNDWGVQYERIKDFRQELDQFAYMPKSETSGVSEFGTLTGLEDLKREPPLEVVPYTLFQENFDSTGTNPLVPKRESDFKVGGDIRYGITPNLNLAATVNPDFGQVEVDPAVINLGAFETRLNEKRPFFLDGASAFDFAPRSQGPITAANLLYTRRIGAAPHLRPPGSPSRSPGNVDIIGAAKLAGRSESGWTLGVLDAATREARGIYDDGSGNLPDAVVEPRTNYFVGRVNREMRDGQSALGGIFTAVNRNTSDPAVAANLTKSAYTGGIDFYSEFANRVWSVSGFLAGSRVEGSSTAVASEQLSPSRYYQRPDATSFHFDPTATSLSGTAGQFNITKVSGVHWTTDTGIAFISPGYEINDMGFQQRTDRRGVFGRVGYNEREPGTFLRSWNVGLNPTFVKNYDGDWVQKSFRLMSNFQHLSFWSLNVQAGYDFDSMDDRFTRGGPVAKSPSGWNVQLRISSDPRRDLTGNVSVSRNQSTSGSRTDEISASLDYRAATHWTLSLDPDLTIRDQNAQYVAAVPDAAATATYGTRYIFAPLHQTQASLVGRLNYSFTPDLSLELYSQALISNGRYGTPKEFLQPREYRFATYGTDLGTLTQNGDTYTVDPDGSGPLGSFTVPDRTFTTRSLRANAVLRWEFRPGSTLYVVWQQNRFNPELKNDFTIWKAAETIFNAKAKNVLAIKLSYWFGP